MEILEMKIFKKIVLAVLLISNVAVFAEEKSPIYIGLDGEFGYKDSTSAEAIKNGILIAIDEINTSGGVLDGRHLALLEKANHSTPARSIANIKEFAANPDVVALFCGRFSPTVLDSLPTIHEQKIPMLNPWSAADAIIDNNYTPNYVFRLSLRDSWAMQTMIPFAGEKKLYKLGLLLLNTSWGRGNLNSAENFVSKNPNFTIKSTQWFNWNDDSLIEKYSAILESGANAIIFVGNPADAVKLIQTENSFPVEKRLPIISHWGITGGNLFELTGESLTNLDFSVIQTYTFLGKSDPKTLKVLAKAKKLFNIDDPRKIESPVGVAHAYDLTHILAKAINLAGSTDRTKIRDALEQVKNYDGLVKHFPQPFTKKQHDALALSDVFMARYAKDGAIERISTPKMAKKKSKK